MQGGPPFNRSTFERAKGLAPHPCPKCRPAVVEDAMGDKIPMKMLGVELDTDDPTGSGKKWFLASLGVTLTAGAVGTGVYVFNQIRQKAGVSDDDVSIPGV